MRRHIITGTILAQAVTEFKRYSGGVTINTVNHSITAWDGRDVTKFKYNTLTPYFNRAVPNIPESTNLNTIITADGLVGIFDGSHINIIDLFENENIDYVGIIPNDFDNLDDIHEYLNPLNKRIFVVNKVGDYMETENDLIFINDSIYYFESKMDYNLLTHPQHGYYQTNQANWTSTYSNTNEFQFYKKQLFIVESNITDLILEFNGVEIPHTAIVGGKKAYYFRDLNISEAEKFIIFKFKSETFNYGYITIY